MDWINSWFLRSGLGGKILDYIYGLGSKTDLLDYVHEVTITFASPTVLYQLIPHVTIRLTVTSHKILIESTYAFLSGITTSNRHLPWF